MAKQQEAMIRIVRNAYPDIYGYYKFRVTGVRAVTWWDKLMFWAGKWVRKNNNISIFDIQIDLSGIIPCTIEVFPDDKLYDKVFKDSRALDLDEHIF